YLSNRKDMENLDINELYIFGDYLTNEGLYELELNKDPELGYKIGSLLKNSVTEKTYIPSSKIGHTGLQLTEKYELVDLSGKLLGEYIDTHLYLVSLEPKLDNYGDFAQFYLSKLKGKTFTKIGRASCSEMCYFITVATDNNIFKITRKHCCN